MNFTDYIFIPLVLMMSIIYFIFPKKYHWIVLLIASILFYCSWGIEFLPFVVGAVIVSYIASYLMDKRYKKCDEEIKGMDNLTPKEKMSYQQKAKKDCKYILWIAVFMIFGVLVYTKSQKMLANTAFGGY